MVEADAALHASAVELLARWRPAEPGADSLRQAYLGYLAARPDAMRRECAPGHLTASAVVCDFDRRTTLLTLHPRIGRWVQLGGHCEPSDRTIVDAALREAVEESGIATLSIEDEPIHLDVHPLTCSGGVPTRHFDVRFLVRAEAGSIEQISSESLDLKWFGFDDLPALDASTLELIGLAARHRS